jgi:hypothetical protein
MGDTTEGNEETVCVRVRARACMCAPALTTNDFGLIFYQVLYDLCSMNFSLALS